MLAWTDFPQSNRQSFPKLIWQAFEFFSVPSSRLQFFSIALAHFSIHCWLFQSSSHTALNRSWNDQNTIWCLQNDTTFSKRITHPSKPNISIKTYNLCSIENVCFLIYLTMDNKIQTTAININLWIHHFNFCATPSQCWLFYQWQHATLWVLYWALLLREYTVRKYLKYENLYTVKYCSTVFVLLNTVKDFVNKVLSTPLIYICSTVDKMAKILTKKDLLQ